MNKLHTHTAGKLSFPKSFWNGGLFSFGLRFLALITISLIYFSCSELEEPPQQIKELEKIAKKSNINLDEPGLNFAASLANGLKSENLRTFVYDKIQEQFDGDFNFLYYTEKTSPIGGPNSKSLTFEEALFGNQNNFKVNNSNLDFDPLMQVALRGEDEDLNAMNEIGEDIPVLYISPNQDLEENPIVPVFYASGEIGEWDIQNVPDNPVLVVSLNERLVKVSRGQNLKIALNDCIGESDPYFSDETDDYYFYDDYYCGSTSGGGGSGDTGGTGGNSGCDRDSNSNWERIDRVKFTSMGYLRDAESWLDGAPEVYLLSSQDQINHIWLR